MASMISCGVRSEPPGFWTSIPVPSMASGCSPVVCSGFAILCSKVKTFALAGSTFTSIQCYVRCAERLHASEIREAPSAPLAPKRLVDPEIVRVAVRENHGPPESLRLLAQRVEYRLKVGRVRRRLSLQSHRCVNGQKQPLTLLGCLGKYLAKPRDSCPGASFDCRVMLLRPHRDRANSVESRR